MDLIDEGIQIACRGVADAIKEGRAVRDAVDVCLAEIEAGEWHFGKYGADADAVEAAARSHLREILRAHRG